MGNKTGIQRSSRNRELMLAYIEKNAGCTKQQIMTDLDLTTNQVGSAMSWFKDSIVTTLVAQKDGARGGKVGTYHVREAGMTAVATVAGAKLVRAGDILRLKYGYTSPDLRKSSGVSIRSGMGDSVYD